MTKQIFNLFLIFILTNTALGQILQDKWVVCNNQGCELLDPYFSEGVTMKWEGNCVNGKADGYGKLIKYKDGEYESTFEGEFEKGIREGKGKFSHKDGTVAIGQFINGQLVGYGTRTSGDGTKYEGEFINYRQHGNGKMTYANGAFFDGFWVSDRMYTGKYTNYNGDITYLQKYYPVKRIDEYKTGYKPQIGVRVTEYFDDNWNRCKQKDASFYRLVTYQEENKPKGVIKDYYISGQLQSEFTAVYLDYDDEGKNFHEGEAIWYYKNGRIEQKRYYYNNNINGKNSHYYDNGEIAQEVNYKNGILDGPYLQWYKTGKPKIIALYENGELVESKFIEYDENGLGALVYHENFLKNQNQWEAKIEGSHSEINKDRQVSLNLSTDNTTTRYNYITLNQNSDYSIESIIQRNSGKDGYMYGIMFGFKDWNNYFHFGITEYGSYRIFGKFEGINIEIADWTKSDAINTGNKRNLLKVLKFDDQFIFSINGTIVKRTESKQLRGNNFGIMAGGKGEYHLENIIVKEFMTSEELANKTPKIVNPNTNEWKGNGTGFFISKAGYIATNYHVISEATEIEIEFIRNGQKQNYRAKVIQSDKSNDLAILKISDVRFKLFTTIPYNFKTSITDVGSNVFALGYPMALTIMGTEIKFTDGKISSKTGFQGDISTYQMTTPIQPGNSGGPLFDFDGNLIGVNSAKIRADVADNVSYAIKTNYLKNLIDVLPEKISIPNSTEVYNKTLTEKIKVLSEYTVLIRIK